MEASGNVGNGAFDLCLFAQLFFEILLWQFVAIPHPDLCG